MTLVAAVELLGVPMLIGDLLLTEPPGILPHSSIPTVNNINNVLPLEDSYPRVAGLRRKLVQVNKWLIFGWTGNAIAGRIIAKEVYAKLKSKRVSRERFFSILQSIGDLGTIRCEIVGWLIDKEGMIAFCWDSQTRTVEISATGFVAGSGTEDFMAQFEDQPVRQITHEANLGAIHVALNLAGNIIGREQLNGEPLLSLYGGGIDIIYLKDGYFQPIESISYQFWSVRWHQNNITFYHRPKYIKSYNDDDDVIIIHAWDTSGSTSVDIGGKSAFYVASSIHQNIKRPYHIRDDHPVIARFHCHFFFVPFLVSAINFLRWFDCILIAC